MGLILATTETLKAEMDALHHAKLRADSPAPVRTYLHVPLYAEMGLLREMNYVMTEIPTTVMAATTLAHGKLRAPLLTLLAFTIQQHQ